MEASRCWDCDWHNKPECSFAGKNNRNDSMTLNGQLITQMLNIELFWGFFLVFKQENAFASQNYSHLLHFLNIFTSQQQTLVYFIAVLCVCNRWGENNFPVPAKSPPHDVDFWILSQYFVGFIMKTTPKKENWKYLKTHPSIFGKTFVTAYSHCLTNTNSAKR